MPVADDRAYCYADRSTPRPLDDPPASRLGRLRERFASFAAPVIEVLDGLDPAEPIHFAPIEEVLHSPSARGRVVLIGDAAHAMSPNMACGAAMAFEDALVLADVIAARGTSPEAIAEFVGRRRPRLDWIRKQTNRRDRLRGLPRLIREPLLRRMAGRTYRANYLPLLDPP